MAGEIIVFSGKGGSGKTTIASMVLQELIRLGKKPVLAVDADPNATLGLTLGVEVPGTIADLRDNLGKAAQNPGEISKQRLLDAWLQELLSEQTGFDLLTMGRPEGPKCYCYVNGLLRRYLSILRENYAYVLVDCEAGMEYLSRLVVDEIQTLVFVAHPTPVGLTTVERIAGLADSLPIAVRRRVLALNNIINPCLSEGAEYPSRPTAGLETVVEVPFDNDVANRCIRGEPIDASAGRQARPAVEELTRLCLGISSQQTGTTVEEPSL